MSPSLPTEGAAGLNYDYDTHSTTDESTKAMEGIVIFMFLIALTILFEKMKTAAEHSGGRVLRPIIDALFGELTILGFLSVVTRLLQQAGLFLAFSRMISGEDGVDEDDEQEDEVYELIEECHFAMFFVMAIFVMSVLSEVRYGLEYQEKWCQWDRACRDKAYVENLHKKNARLDEEFAAITSMTGLRGKARRTWRFFMPYLRFLPFLRDESREAVEDKMEFCALRHEFLEERSDSPPFASAGTARGKPKTIGQHFNFGRYLTFTYAKKMAAMVDIDVTTWLLFAGGTVFYYLLLGALGYSMQALAWAWLLIGWIFHVTTVNFEKYLLGIRDKFLAPCIVPTRKIYNMTTVEKRRFSCFTNTIGTEAEPLREQVAGLPMWCYINIDELDRNRSKLSRVIFGPTPRNRQHALYIGGIDGSESLIFCLRAMLVFSCIYSAQMIVLFIPMMVQDQNTSTFTTIVYSVLAVVPALAFIFNKKRLIGTLVQVGSIGPFVLVKGISYAEREEKTSMAVRALVLYFQVVQMTNRFLVDPSRFVLAPTKLHYSNIISLEDIAELGRMFRLFFDHNADGSFCAEDFQVLLSTVRMTIDRSEANGLLTAIVKSTKNKYSRSVNVEDTASKSTGTCGVSVSTEEFFQWYANNLGEYSNKHECAQFLFSLFDADGSGDVTLMEVKQQLENMHMSLTEEDANELIHELDENGNGFITEKEFFELVERFYPVELHQTTPPMRESDEESEKRLVPRRTAFGVGKLLSASARHLLGS